MWHRPEFVLDCHTIAVGCQSKQADCPLPSEVPDQRLSDPVVAQPTPSGSFVSLENRVQTTACSVPSLHASTIPSQYICVALPDTIRCSSPESGGGNASMTGTRDDDRVGSAESTFSEADETIGASRIVASNAMTKQPKTKQIPARKLTAIHSLFSWCPAVGGRLVVSTMGGTQSGCVGIEFAQCATTLNPLSENAGFDRSPTSYPRLGYSQAGFSVTRRNGEPHQQRSS